MQGVIRMSLASTPRHCVEASAAGTTSAVFQRRWSKATVELDCMEWTSKIEMKTDDAAAAGVRLLAVVSGAALAPAPAAALENGLARTPPMGWRSWCEYSR